MSGPPSCAAYYAEQREAGTQLDYRRDQVVHEADLEGDFEAKRRMPRVFNKLAETVMTFLAQIEDARKRLFEKPRYPAPPWKLNAS
jgi:hypothetical protein